MGRLSIRGEKFSLSEDANSTFGLERCDECRSGGHDVCTRGSCHDGWSTWGYLCSCPPGLTGNFCERDGNSCLLSKFYVFCSDNNFFQNPIYLNKVKNSQYFVTINKLY